MKSTSLISHACLVGGLLLLAGCQSYSPSATKWETLFDGSTMSQVEENFRAYGRPALPSGHWVLDGDALKTVPGRPVDLITRQMYQNFELRFEWKVSPGGNSGVMYYVAETDGPAWHTGPEFQILDDDRHPDGRNPKRTAGSLYDLIVPSDKKQLRPVGEFNRSRIVVRHGNVEHWVNGEKVVEYNWSGQQVRDLIDRSKFKDLPRFMKEPTGHIVIQHHGEEAWFRNVRIQRL